MLSMWKVAIFDDNQVVEDALCRSIDWKSINCSICGVASNGTDALAVINNAQPNIVITDILMPGFSGLELAAMAKKTHQSTKFIIITGFSNAKFARQSVRLSVFDYISKPVDNEEIVKVVLEAIDALRQDNNSLQKEPDDVVEAALSAVYGKIGSYSKLTSDVIRYVNENYSQPKISLQATAAEFFVSPSYLSGHFKEETGIGFISFLTMVRLVQAKKQLESGHASISQVAYQVGYKDYSYFFQVFKKYYGYAPGHFIN